MKKAFWILTCILIVVSARQPVLSRTLTADIDPGHQHQPVSINPTSLFVMSRGQIEMIDLEAARMRVNSVTYAFDNATNAVDMTGRRMQTSRLKAGDWVNFWLKSGASQSAPLLKQIVLLPKP